MSNFDPKEHKLTDEDFSKIKYTNLKNHTGYTLQMGFGTTKEHLKMCVKKGHQGCVFTDKGVMMGALDLYNKAQDKKILEAINYEGKKFPIIMGASLFLTEDTNIKNRAQKYYTVTVYAKNQAGYENLCFLTSIASQDDKFYVRPRIDLMDLFSNKDGVICSSGGVSGMIGQAILENKGKFRGELFSLLNNRDRLDEVKDFLDKFKDVNAPDKVSKLIEVMHLESDDRDAYWRKWLVEESFWNMFPKLLNSPELLQLLYDTENKFPLDKVDFAMVDSMPWEEDEKGALFGLLTDIDVEIIISKFKEEFGEDFYFELSVADARWRWVKDLKQHEDIGYNPQDVINQRLSELALKYNIKCVLVQDSHMPDADQHLLQSIMIWNSPSGKDGWSFYEALEIMDIPTMYEKTIDKYPWISDDQFLEWTNNSDEVLQKCKNCKLNFEPSLPTLDYEGHYVNRVPIVIRRTLIIELQERKLWSEELKSKLMEFQSFAEIEGIPDDIKIEFDTKEKIIDFEDMEKRGEENIFLEDVLKQMKSFYKKEKDFVKMLTRSETDLALRTSLKVMIRNKKLLTKLVDEVRLNEIIASKAPGKTSKDYKPEIIQNVINKHNLYKISEDPMLLLGARIQRDRIVEEVTTIQYNGIIQLISYFMLLEDVSNFIAENGYLRGFGRGSGAGSIVAYALDITDCDPLEYNLLFERFLTTERIGEVFYEIDSVSLKDFLVQEGKDAALMVSSEDLKLDDEDLGIGVDENSDNGDDL